MNSQGPDATPDPCFERPTFSANRFFIFLPLFLAMIPGRIVHFILLAGPPYGIQFAPIVVYGAAVVLCTFSKIPAVQGILRHAHPHVTKERYIKIFDPSVVEAMERLQATEEVRGSVSSNWQARAEKAHAKLLMENRGEMAEWLKAAVC